MISLKWIKSLTTFYWLETNLCQNCIWKGQDLLVLLVEHRKAIQRFRETGHLKHLNKNELDKACFVHDATYSDSNDLAKRTISDKILKDKAFEIAKNCNCDGYQRALANKVHKVFDKKTGSGVIVNEQLAEELHKPVI